MGHDRARWGSVTFVQRFGSSLNLNPHVHVLMLDGVYVDGEEAPVFVPAPPLSDQAVQQIVETSARRIMRLCTKRGLLDDTAADPLTDEEPMLAALTAASVRGLTATGARTGQRLRRVLKDPATGVRTAPLCFASQRLSFALKTPWSDGTRPLLLSPMELLEKLAALVPPPRFHLLRYHGVLAPRARDRDRIVPAQPGAEPAATDGDASAASCGHRRRWATLLARVFSADLSECAACGGRLRIIAARTDPASIRTCLEGVGMPAMPPPRAPPEPLFEFAA